MENCLLIVDDVCNVTLAEKADLIVSSPPYGIGKSYERAATLTDYTAWAEKLVKVLKNNLKPNGSICWQVGTYVDKNGEYIPLDIVYVPIFRSNGFFLKNRIVWKFGSGLHSDTRFSGRYEVVLWFVAKADEYTFNLDTVRINSKEPSKRSFKGPNKGKLSGNPLGKNPTDVWNIIADEWERAEWDFPNVKSNHVEKCNEHPCQFPIELAERCILVCSNENDLIFDPFCGTGSTGCAAVFHNRKFVGVDFDENFIEIAKKRLQSAVDGTLKTRKIGTVLKEASSNAKTRQIPEEWTEIRDEQSKKRRIYPQWKEESN